MIDEIFKSFIWKTKVNYKGKYDLINNIENNYKSNPNLTPKGWKCSVHSSFNSNYQLPIDLINILEKNSNDFLNIFEKNTKIKGKYFILNSWYNAYDRNQFQEPHTHGDSLFSGCYYLKFDKKYHHQTNFYNPNFNINNTNLENNSYFCFSPDCEEDDLIIFPSYLKHGTKGSKTDNLRITVSFNIHNNLVSLQKSTHNPLKYY